MYNYQGIDPRSEGLNKYFNSKLGGDSVYRVIVGDKIMVITLYDKKDLQKLHDLLFSKSFYTPGVSTQGSSIVIEGEVVVSDLISHVIKAK